MVLQAQTWSQALAVGGEGNESCRGVVVGNGGDLVIGGSFSGEFRPTGEALKVFGGQDVFLAGYAAERSAAWAVSVGSRLDDQLDALALAPDGDLIVAGGFWLEGFFGDTVLETTLHPRAIFLARFNSSGTVRWVKSIEGSDLKQVNSVAVDEAGHLYLAGHFSGILAIGTDTLTAQGASDLFLGKFTADGELIWVVQEGYSGDTRALSLAVTEDQEVVAGGYFNDTTFIAGQWFTANTFDRDVFVARYDNQGQALWARKAGGVLDDDIAELAIDEFGDIYVTGYLVGVMKLDEEITIQSSTGWSDFYLIRYRADGKPLAARAMGGSRLQQASGMVMAGGRALISGFYQGEMTIDGITIAADEFAFSSFVVALDQDLKASWLKDISGAPSVFATRLGRAPNDVVWIGGNFTGDLQFDETVLTATAGFDIFLAQLAPALTPLDKVPNEAPDFQLFPNPAGEWVNIRAEAPDYLVELFTSNGSRIGVFLNPLQISTTELPAGAYWLRLQANGRISVKKIIVQ